MRKLFAVLVALVAAGCMASAASAAVWDPPTGTLEVCKATVPTGGATLPVSGAFTFTIKAGTQTITRTVNVGECSGAITVPSGTVTVSETVPDWASIVSVVQNRPTGPTALTRTGTGGNTVSVTVAPGGPESESLVTFTNQLVTGTIEVCKQGAPGSGLSGNFNFSLTNAAAAGHTPLASTTVAVPVGGCSNPITIAAGDISVVETDAGGAVTAINVSPSSALKSSNLGTATALVRVDGGTTSTNGPIVTFTNNSALLKVCKIAGDGVTVGTPFTFTATPAGAGGPTQPFAVTAGTAATGGNCVTVGTYRQGTTVAITEAVAAGTMVPTGGIVVTPSGRVVPGSLNEGARTVSVVVSTGTTIVTYTNVAAPPGTLKICKTAGAGVAAGTSFSFTVTGTAGTTTVLAGSCAIVGGPINPTTFPFRSVQTITEATTSPAATTVTAISVTPSDRLVGTPNLAGRSVQVSIGSFVTNAAAGETIATFTNAATPPATLANVGSGVVVPGGVSVIATPGSGASSTQSAAAQLQSALGAAKVTSTAKSVAKTRLVLARITMTHGKVRNHILTAKVTSSHKTVKIAVLMFGAHGKQIATRYLTIAANHQVSKTIKWAANVTKVTVRLANTA